MNARRAGGLGPRSSQRGLTLLEVMAGLAVLAVLAAMALPSWSGMAQRHRLAAAAEALAADLREARFEAVRSGQPLYLQSQPLPDAGWCWTVARQAGCGCAEAAASGCSLKTVRADDHPGIRLLQPLQAKLLAQGQAGELGQAAHTELATAQGQRLRVELAALGRSRVCLPEGAEAAASLSNYPRC